MADTILRKYGVSATINFELASDANPEDLQIAATFAAGDVKIMKDEGAEANTTNLPTDEGTGYSLVLTATEMQAARIMIYLIDQTATKVWMDKAIRIETYGNASASHAFDLDTATQSVNVSQISNDTVAADNAELFFDGTGYAGGTTKLQVDAVAISGDTVAADNLELDYDGTGYNKSNSTIGTCTTLTGHTPQTGDSYAIVNHASYGNAQLVRSTTPANTLDVSATGEAGIDWGNIGNPTTVVDLAGTDINKVDTCTTNTDMRGTDNALLASSAPTNFGDLAITATTGKVTVGTNDDKTGYSISGTKTTLDALNDISTAQVNTEVDNALNTAIPASPTADSINERVKAIDDKLPSGTISDFDEASNNVTLAAATHTGATIPTVTSITNRVTANSDQIAGNANAATQLSLSARTIVSGTAQTGTLSTTQMTTDLTEATTDHYKSRIIIWTSGALQNQATDITAYSGTGGLLTFTAVTEAPANGDKFIII